jgi:hypothetical protein
VAPPGPAAPATRPFTLLALLAPQGAEILGGATLRVAAALDALRLRKAAFKVVTLAYTVDYARGLRAELGSARAALKEAWAFRTAQGSLR